MMLLNKAVELYAARYADGNLHTWKAKQYDLGYFLAFCSSLGTRSLLKITPAVLANFVADRLALGEAPRTVQRRLNNVRAFLNWCGRHFREFENPAPEVKPLRVPTSQPRWLEAEELEQIRLNLLTGDPFRDLRNRAIIELMARAGLRRAEVVNLNIGQLDTKTWTLKNVKRKAGRVQNIFLSSSVIESLTAYLPERDKILSAASRETSESFCSTVRLDLSRALPLFISKHAADWRLSTEAVYKLVRAISARADMKSVHPHQLRHTFVNDFLKLTNDIRLTAAVAGHASVNTTMLYTEPKEKQQQEAISKLD